MSSQVKVLSVLTAEARCCDGDELLEVGKWVIRFLRWRFQNLPMEDIQEIASDLTLQIFEHRHSFKGTTEGEARAYLRMMAHNRGVTLVQNQKKRDNDYLSERADNNDPDPEDELDQLNNADESPKTTPLVDDAWMDIKSFYKDRASPTQRKIIALIYAGLNQKQISDHLDIAESLVSKVVKQMRAKFKRYLEE